MSEAKQHISDIMQRAALDHQIPTPIAQVFMLVAAELLDQAKLSKELAETARRQGDAIIRLGKEIDRLNGVHGA